MKILKRNSLVLGLILGLVIPAALYGFMFWLTTFRPEANFNQDTLLVISITANVILFRQYMMKWDMEESGKGMLFATFVYAFVFFYFFLDV
ncbi:MAG: hypothetical protein J4F31_06015 [Flavobacteriales bacterium]|nr:hypothetical protein [Flavobacteriales bacterium]